VFELELLFQNLTVEEYNLKDGAILIIGRQSDNDIVLEDEAVSRVHAGISQKGQDLVIWDKGSRNGTIVNGKKVESAVLKNGDVVRFGARYFLKVYSAPGKHKERTQTGEHDN
jgi:pSer/pThr/pTyr-binding forkhead associated (FHA) protein